jgi:hypothetical protein
MAQHKVNTECANLDREVGGNNRGLTMQSRMQCAFMAQIKDDADQHHRDIHMVMILKQIESMERLIKLKLKTSERMSMGGSEVQVFMTINILMEKLEKLNEDLDSMMNEKRVTNPIVGNVLAIATKVMGLPKRDKDYDNNDEFGSDLLK